VSAPKTAADATFDMLAEELWPRFLRKLREQAGDDDGLAELLAGAGFEIDSDAEPAPRVKLAPAARRGRAA
jgi:hypothetical protein